MDHSLAIGDTVRLKSGSPLMTVEGLVGCFIVRCIWFNLNQDLQQSNIRVEALQKKAVSP